jgi:hypothetical protein
MEGKKRKEGRKEGKKEGRKEFSLMICAKISSRSI